MHGGHQSDVARDIATEGLTVADLVHETVTAILDDAGVAAADVESIHVDNAFGQLHTGQAHRAATLNIGGSTATTACFVVEGT